MASLYRRLDRVRSLGVQAAESVLDAALPHASPEERDAIVAELLEHTAGNRVGGLEIVLRHWLVLSEEARRAAVVVGVDHLDALISRAVGQGMASARRAAARLLPILVNGSAQFSAGELAVLAHACADLARDADPEVSGQGVSALAALGRDVSCQDPDLCGVIDRALIEAGDSWQEHRSEGVLEAIALRADRAGPLLASWLAEADHPSHMALRGAARKMRPDELAPRLVRWLSIPALAPVATSRLSARPTELERTHALADWHLLCNPRRRAAVARMGNCEGLLGAVPGGADQSGARVGMVRWCARARITPVRRRALLSAMLATGDPLAQWASVRVMDTPGAGRDESLTLLDFALAGDPRVAAHAARMLTMTRSALKWRACVGPVRALSRSPHQGVRRTVEESARWRDPMRGVADVWGCGVGARALLAADRAGLIEDLRAMVSGGEGDRRMQAMRLAARLELTREIEVELIAATCGTTDTRVVAKAVSLLARASSPPARAAVESALRSDDGRVRATAVEVVSKWRDRDGELAGFVGDAAPRVRANAIVHFLKTPRTRRSASIAIHEMLNDQRAGHRLSALWAAEVGGQTELADRARELSMHDSDEHVRRRAMRCARTLASMTRRSWCGPVPTQTAGAA